MTEQECIEAIQWFLNPLVNRGKHSAQALNHIGEATAQHAELSYIRKIAQETIKTVNFSLHNYHLGAFAAAEDKFDMMYAISICRYVIDKIDVQEAGGYH